MQHFSEKKKASAVCKNTSQAIYLALTVVAMFLNGCAVKTAYRFSAKSVTQITYNPDKCAETVDGKFRCKEVVFTVATIEPVKDK